MNEDRESICIKKSQLDCVFFLEIGSKLDSAEQRCNVLERQLEYMRRMVHSAESDRSEVLRKTAHLQRQQVRARSLYLSILSRI